MGYNPKIHRRRSLRLEGYDYTHTGAYFVTIVTQGRLCLFGEIVGQKMQLNAAGEMVCKTWKMLPQRFPTIEIDMFVVMPSHLHGIVVINQSNRATTRVAPTKSTDVGAGLVPAQNTNRHTENAAIMSDRVTTRVALGDVIGAYKSLTTVEYVQGVKTMKWGPFHGRLWQRNYYEHIVQHDESLLDLQQYILDNPAQWDFDKENPLAKKLETEKL